MEEKKKNAQKAYQAYVDQVTPKHSCLKNSLYAFISGGLICATGQGLLNFFEYMGVPHDIASNYMTLLLILTSVSFSSSKEIVTLVFFIGSSFTWKEQARSL